MFIAIAIINIPNVRNNGNNNSENPYIRRISPEVITVDVGEALTLTFHVALNSDGNQWDTDMEFTFNSTTEDPITVRFTQTNRNQPQHFSLDIFSAEESHSGVYSVMVPGEFKV